MPLRCLLLIVQWLAYVMCSANLRELWSYSGIDFSTPSPLRVFLSLLLLIAVAALLPQRVDTPSKGAVWFIATFLVVPTIAVAAVNPQYDFETKILSVLTVMIGLPVVVAVTRVGKPIAVAPTGLLSPGAFYALLVALTCVAIATVVFGYGLSGFNIGFDDAYARRAVARTLANPFPGSGYLITWIKQPLSILLVTVALQWRRSSGLVLAVIASLALFSLTGEKTAAFMVPFAWLCFVVYRRELRHGSNIPWWGIMNTGLVAIPAVIGKFFPGSEIDYMLTRRMGLDPAILTHEYVLVATNDGFTFFSQGLLKWLATGDDRQSIGYRVGEILTPGAGQNANANAWADGYVSAGIVGVVITSILVGLVMRVADGLAASRDVLVAGVTLAVTLKVFVDGYFHTAILTGGVLAGLLLIWVMPTGPEYPRWGQEVRDARATRIPP